MPLAAATLFFASALLFLVQPMTARHVLPLLGGTPAVWTTCMLFFQTALLAGYWYAHKAPRPVVHVVLVVLGLVPLCLTVPPFWNEFAGGDAVLGLLAMLVATIGLPFFVLASTSPLVQSWLVREGRTTNPYVLFAASNAGSLVGLLAYPLLVEPTLPLRDQRVLLAAGYTFVAVLLVGAALRKRPAVPASAVTRNANASAAALPRSAALPIATSPIAPPPITNGQRVRWLLLAMVPSSLLLGVTTHVTTNLAPVPLLWAIPLALYLLTFVIVFRPRRTSTGARRTPAPSPASVFAALRPANAPSPAPPVLAPVMAGRRATLPMWVPSFLRWHESPRPIVAILPAVLLPLVVFFWWEETEHGLLILGLHLVAVFCLQLALHGRLADERPEPARLTEFYLWIALGGALGGVCNALVAPFVFSGPIEYPLMLAAACFLLPGTSRSWVDVVWALCVVVVAGILVTALPKMEGGRLLALGPPAVLALLVAEPPLRLGTMVAGLLLVGGSFNDRGSEVIWRDRSVFGAHHVERLENDVTCLVHGNILHGAQGHSEAMRREPLTYYHREGPCGEIFAALAGRIANGRVGAVGLGVGSIAAYGAAGERWTFFEIDAAIERTARSQFTFLADSAAAVDVRIRDGRLGLADTNDGEFGLLVFDAFNSDAVPVHLLTREALAIYVRKLAPGGVLAFHVSSQYLDLMPVLADLAADANLVAIGKQEPELTKALGDQTKSESEWVVMARSVGDLGGLSWPALVPRGRAPWTDDRSSLVREMKFF